MGTNVLCLGGSNIMSPTDVSGGYCVLYWDRTFLALRLRVNPSLGGQVTCFKSNLICSMWHYVGICAALVGGGVLMDFICRELHICMVIL